jgi:hypothetical protein
MTVGHYLFQIKQRTINRSLYPPTTSQDDQIKITTIAKAMYDRAKTEGKNFDSGPCLGIIPGFSDWVVDIAHNPRLPIDDDPANQCEAYRTGQAHHFIELDPNGNVIKIY